MKAKVTVHKLPVHTPFAIASGTMEAADCVVVSLDDECGHTGLGEAAPFSAVTGENIAHTAAAVTSLCASIANVIPEHAIKILVQAAQNTEFPISAICAVESAVFDLIARRQSLPLWRLFGSPAVPKNSAAGTPAPRRITTDITVPVMAPEAVPAFMDKFANHGFQDFKVKVAGNVDADTASVRAVADWCTTHNRPTTIILDGNQGFDLIRARALLGNLGRLKITPACFEQPLPKSDLKNLAKLAATTGVPILLDESVTTVGEIHQAFQEHAGSMINIKIMKSGVIESLRMITAAKSLGLKMMIGGMLETEIAMGFSLHMAAGLGGFDFIDLDTPFFIDQRLTRQSPWHEQSSALLISNSPGAGLETL